MNRAGVMEGLAEYMYYEASRRLAGENWSEIDRDAKEKWKLKAEAAYNLYFYKHEQSRSTRKDDIRRSWYEQK